MPFMHIISELKSFHRHKPVQTAEVTQKAKKNVLASSELK